MEEDMEHLMIMAIVPLGYSDKVIEAANNAGANGATTLRARGADKAGKEGLFSFKIEPEEEIILIVVSKDIINQVCEAVGKEFKNSERGGSLYLLPVQSVEDL
jgi:nitrogen regulatory protein PII